jgi:sigma-B regulation protein RsbU (phosphoserine phosphatase)
MIKQNTKILLVDDDPFVRDMLSMILEAGGYVVETSENGADAVKKFSADSGINLIISDMNMPEMNGLELIKKIRKNNEDIPIIILTGNNEISVAIEAMNSGANDYLIKDENIQDTIILSVERVMEKYQIKKQNQQLIEEIRIRNKELGKERILAQKVQKSILPVSLDFKGVEIGTFYQASSQIGGDFYDAWETDSAIHFILGDVSGHSISSALIMATCKGMLHSMGQTMHTQIEIVTATNRMLCEIVSEVGMFITLVYACLIKQKNEIHILSAGHHPVFILNAKGLQTITSTGPVLGWDINDHWEVVSYQFNIGDSLFLYTDGLSEAKNSSEEEFGEERLKSLLQLQANEPPRVQIEKIFQEVNGFCSSKFTDDVAMFAIKRND